MSSLYTASMSSHRADAALISAVVPAGGWALARGRALSLRPAQASQLRVTQGRVWATLHTGADGQAQDHVLTAGQSLQVPAGSLVVMEAWDCAAAAPTAFAWDVVTFAASPAASADWALAVQAPGREAVQAMAALAAATARLVVGLARWLLQGRRLEPARMG